MSDPSTYEGWVSAYDSSTDYEADLVRDRLDEAGIPAVVLTQRDHAFNLNIGDLARVHVMVRPEQADAARDLIASQPFSDAELEQAALSADVMAPDAHSPADEALLDSGIDEITLTVPDDDPEDAPDDAPSA